jgi:hypothetical protein
MRLIALIGIGIWFGFLATGAVAQNVPQRAAAPPSSGLCGSSGNPAPITVDVLPTGYDPQALFPAYVRPPTAGSAPPPAGSTLASMVSDIRTAFSNAPGFFQYQLCGLDGIYLSTDWTQSFGFRENPKQLPPNTTHFGRYVVLSASAIWGSTGTPAAPNFSAWETTLLHNLLNWPGSDTYPPKFAAGVPATTDVGTTTVLAALAHEFGHVLWYDTFRPTSGGAYDFNTFCGGSFYSGSWAHVDPPPTWRTFGDTQGEPVASPDAQGIKVKINDILLALANNTTNGLNQADQTLRKIFKEENHWASLFAAFSPDEDFVETFKFAVLQNMVNPLQSLQLNFYDRTNGTIKFSEDVYGDFYKGSRKVGLRRKYNCFFSK